MFAAWGFSNEAVAEAEKAVALDGNDATAHAGLASALVQAERPAEGLDYIQQALRLDPHHPPNYLIILGAAQFGMERFEEAAATFERAVKRNPDNELPLIYLASSYGHLGRVKDADNAIEAANDIQAKLGMGSLTLEKKPDTYNDTPFRGEIDFPRFGGKLAQARVRAGLSDIPALTWQYRVTTHEILGSGNTWFEVEGATEIDFSTAKSFYDRGMVFIDVGHPDDWKKEHIPGAVNLTYVRVKGSTVLRFTEETLMAVADKTIEIVVYCSGTCWAAWQAAEAANWGYQKVYFLRFAFGKAQAWKDAGYPVETGQ
jgi:tetratricopeptide (TPR) repeat protein